MRPRRTRLTSTRNLSAVLVAVCWLCPAVIFAGETCLAPDEMFGWHLVGGQDEILYVGDDPTCNKEVKLDGNLRCGGWLGMLITQRPRAVEHRVVIDLSQVNFNTGAELVFWQSLRQGEKPTMQLKVTNESTPELLVELQSDDRFASAVAEVTRTKMHEVVIRWSAPVQAGSGTFEVQVDGLQTISESGLTFEQKLPDYIQVGLINCPPGGSGAFIFNPLSTTFEHF